MIFSYRYKLSDTEWANADLQPGLNPGYFSVDSLSIRIPFNVFLFEQDARFVLTDVDGTITETDVKGHVFPMFGFTAHHEHVVELFHKIADNGYQIVYLTARSIAQDVDTREYLFEVPILLILDIFGKNIRFCQKSPIDTKCEKNQTLKKIV